MKMKPKPLIITALLTIFLLSTSLVQATNHTPLPQLGNDTYQDVIGGLYLDGNNSLPESYQLAVNDTMAELESDTSINVICNGMSNMMHTCGEFIERMQSADVNPAVNVINCGRPSRTIKAFDGSSPGEVYFNCKKAPNPNANSIDVAIFFNARMRPDGEFLPYVDETTSMMREVYANIQAAYPNVKLIYFVSRESAPEWASDLNPEPFNYWDGFAFRNVINERINDTLTGVLLIWGPYQYDPSWPDSYFREGDGVHLSDDGLAVAGQLWLDFFMTQSWFANGDPLPTSTPAPTSIPGTPTATSEPTATPLPSSTPTITPTGSGWPPPEFCEQHPELRMCQ